MAKKYYWLKLQNDFFDSVRIKKLRKLAGGDTYTIIYLKMQLNALKKDGVLTYTGLEQSFAEELALDIDEEPDDVAVTLQYLKNCGLVETSDDIEYFLPYVIENTGSENASAQRVREYRQRQKALHCNTDVTEVKRFCNAEKEIEKEKSREEIEKSKSRDIKTIVEYLNQSIGSHYKADVPKTISLINARLKEGFTEDDFKLVIDKKVKDWANDSKMQKYLRPETLFGTKFEGYLNEIETKSTREKVDSWL